MVGRLSIATLAERGGRLGSGQQAYEPKGALSQDVSNWPILYGAELKEEAAADSLGHTLDTRQTHVC